jgi:hypothetical protein
MACGTSGCIAVNVLPTRPSRSSATWITAVPIVDHMSMVSYSVYIERKTLTDDTPLLI